MFKINKYHSLFNNWSVFFEEKTVNQDKVSEQEDKMLSSRYGTTYPSVTEMPEREDTKQISE